MRNHPESPDSLSVGIFVEKKPTWKEWEKGTCLGVDSPFFPTIVPLKNLAFPLGFWRFSRKKDSCKEWKWKVPPRTCIKLTTERNNELHALYLTGAASGEDPLGCANCVGCLHLSSQSLAVGQNTQSGTLANGNMDYNLRSPNGLTLTHTLILSGTPQQGEPFRTSLFVSPDRVDGPQKSKRTSHMPLK